jgi:hypothetical protein
VIKVLIVSVVALFAFPADAQERQMSASACLNFLKRANPLIYPPAECDAVIREKLEHDRLCSEAASRYGPVRLKQLYPTCLSEERAE